MSAAVTDSIDQIRARNDELRGEVTALRDFLDTLQALVETLDRPREDSEIMAALSASLEGVLTVLDAAHGELLVHDEERDELVLVFAHGDARVETWQTAPAGDGMLGWVLRRGEAIIANEAPSDERFDASVDQPAGLTAETLLLVPVIGRDKTMGVVRIVNKRDNGLFDEDAQTLVSLMGRFAGELLAGMADRHGGDDAPE